MNRNTGNLRSTQARRQKGDLVSWELNPQKENEKNLNGNAYGRSSFSPIRLMGEEEGKDILVQHFSVN